MNEQRRKYINTYAIKVLIFSVFIIGVFTLISCLSIYFKINMTEEVFKNNEAAELTVIIDAGHGGVDTGATGILGKYESELCLEVSNKLAHILSMSNVNVVMTRTDDRLLQSKNSSLSRKQSDLQGRVEFTESYTNPIFVSIHMNTYPLESCTGSQIFYSPNSEDSEDLAAVIKESLGELSSGKQRENKKSGSNIYVLNHLKCPAVLIECGFITNKEEATLLNDEKYQRKLAVLIANGISNFIDSER